MLSGKPWKLDAIMRLLLSVLVCYFAGAFLLAAIHHGGSAAGGRLTVYVLVAGSLLCLGGALWLLQGRWRFGDGLRRAAIMMGLFYVGLVLGGWASKIAGPGKSTLADMIVSTVSLQGALLLLLGGFLREHQTNCAEAFGLKKSSMLAFLVGVMVACAVTPGAWLLQVASSKLLSALHVDPELQQVVRTLDTEHGTTARLLIGALTLLVAPVAEEVLFRGIAFSWVKERGYPRLALWGTSLAFAAIHVNFAAFVPLTFLAVALAMIYERTGNLLAPIAAHAVFNAANLVKFYLIEQAPYR